MLPKDLLRKLTGRVIRLEAKDDLDLLRYFASTPLVENQKYLVDLKSENEDLLVIGNRKRNRSGE